MVIVLDKEILRLFVVSIFFHHCMMEKYGLIIWDINLRISLEHFLYVCKKDL